MAVEFHILNLVVMFFISILPFCYSRGSPEVFYPIETPSPAPSQPISTELSSSLPSPERLPDSQPPPRSPSSSSHDTNTSSIAKAVAATAACTIVIAGIFFFFVIRYALAQPKRQRVGDSVQGGQPRLPPDEFAGINGNIKGFIVEENGLDVLYWRQLQEGANKNGFQKEILYSPNDEEGEEGGGGGGMVRQEGRSRKVAPVQAIPLLRGKSSTSTAIAHGHVPVPPAEDDDSGERIGLLSPLPSHGIVLKDVEKREATVQLKFLPAASIPPPQLPIPPLPLPIQNNGSSLRPKAPPPLNRNTAKPLPPVPATSPPPPPPSPNKAGGSAAARDKSSRDEPGESSGSGAMDGNNQGKLKPLHWDKVKKNVDLSMVRDKNSGGSFKFDDELMEALFGSVATNRKSPTGNSSSNSKNTKTSKH